MPKTNGWERYPYGSGASLRLCQGLVTASVLYEKSAYTVRVMGATLATQQPSFQEAKDKAEAFLRKMAEQLTHELDVLRMETPGT